MQKTYLRHKLMRRKYVLLNTEKPVKKLKSLT
jgi:hypothetical protein